MIVFISVACGAGMLARAERVGAAEQQHRRGDRPARERAPISWPSCWRAGVAPTSQPVLRSCEMSPAFDAATATIVPTVSTAGARAGVDPAGGGEDARRCRAASRARCPRSAATTRRRCRRCARRRRRTAGRRRRRRPRSTARWTGAMSPAKTPGTSAATSTTVAIAADHEPRRAGRDRCARRVRRRRPRRVRRMPRATAGERARHRRQVREHGQRCPPCATAPAPM